MTEIVINKCPCCGSENKTPLIEELKRHFSFSSPSGYGSIGIYDDKPYWYYICTDCGTVYASVEKLKQIERSKSLSWGSDSI